MIGPRGSKLLRAGVEIIVIAWFSMAILLAVLAPIGLAAWLF